MTNVTEARLAREAEICYSTLALVTDYDCWKEEEEAVTADAIIEILNRNASNAKKIIINALSEIPDERSCSCGSALATALVTNPASIPAKTRENLDIIIGKYLK
jgi:5'-methylthioadenosine phosphorylase